MSFGIIFAIGCTAGAEAAGVSKNTMSRLALPSENCKVPSLNGWTAPEKWAWKEICEGRDASFNTNLDVEELDATNPDLITLESKWHLV